MQIKNQQSQRGIVGENSEFLNEIPSLVSVADRYDLILIDIWGVTHNGVEPFPKAIEAYKQMKAIGKTLVVLSNAPRLPNVTRTRLSAMGIDDTLFDDVMNSLLECHEELRDRTHPFFKALGTKIYHVGPERDRTVFEGLPYTLVDTVEKADFLLITGTDGWFKTTDSYTEMLTKAYDRGLPAVCANADRLVQNGDELVICAGAIAEAYQNLGAKNIHIHGKPNASVFAAAHALGNKARGKEVPLSRVLMLGDSLATDIRGSNMYGIDCVFTLSGVHKETLPEDYDALFQGYNATPTYIMYSGIC
jgi:HAD superfamily hydrolase (TIGR01459 family)